MGRVAYLKLSFKMSRWGLCTFPSALAWGIYTLYLAALVEERQTS